MVAMSLLSLASVAISVAARTTAAFSLGHHSSAAKWSSATHNGLVRFAGSHTGFSRRQSRRRIHGMGGEHGKLQMAIHMPPKAQPKIPITLLSGFLGAGKTTTLQHLLENQEGAKIGVIVNDVASVNIDSKLVSKSNEGVVELKNGCACCSLSDELIGAVGSLISDRKFDAVVVELSGVADPIAIKSNWNHAKANDHPITQLADIAQVVTLVDASTFGTDWMTWDLAAQRDGWVDTSDECAGNRKISELLAEQVEAASLILMNKVDLAGDDVHIASSLARSLNEKAVMQEVKYGKVSPKLVLKDTPGYESCHDSQEGEHDSTPTTKDTSTDDLGITSFVYRAARPFNMRKLMIVLNQWPVPIKDELDLEFIEDAKAEGYDVEGQLKDSSPFTGVLRSKGFCWFAPTRWDSPNDDVWRHDTAMYWSHAGKTFGINSAGKWWGTVSKEQMAGFLKDDMEEYKRILEEDFVSEEYGDRRQEIVFIGVNMKQDEITSVLDSCLLGKKGMGRYRQELEKYQAKTFTTPGGQRSSPAGSSS